MSIKGQHERYRSSDYGQFIQNPHNSTNKEDTLRVIKFQDTLNHSSSKDRFSLISNNRFSKKSLHLMTSNKNRLTTPSEGFIASGFRSIATLLPRTTEGANVLNLNRQSRFHDEKWENFFRMKPIIYSKIHLANRKFDQTNEQNIIGQKIHTLLMKEGEESNNETACHQSTPKQNGLSSFRDQGNRQTEKSGKASSSKPTNRFIRFDSDFNLPSNVNLENLTSTRFFRETKIKRFFQSKKSEAIVSSQLTVANAAIPRKHSPVRVFSNIVHLALIKPDPAQAEGEFRCVVISEDLQSNERFRSTVYDRIKTQLKFEDKFLFFYDLDGCPIEKCTTCKTGCACLKFITEGFKKSSSEHKDRLLFIISKVEVSNIFEFGASNLQRRNFKKRCKIFGHLFMKNVEGRIHEAVQKTALDIKGSFRITQTPISTFSIWKDYKQLEFPKTSTAQKSSLKMNLKGNPENVMHFRGSRMVSFRTPSNKISIKEVSQPATKKPTSLRKTLSCNFLQPRYKENIQPLCKVDAKIIADKLIDAYFKSPDCNSEDLKKLFQLVKGSESSKNLNNTVKSIMNKDLLQNSRERRARKKYFESELPLQANPNLTNLLKLNEHYVEMLRAYISDEEAQAVSYIKPNEVTDSENQNLLVLLEQMISDISHKEGNTDNNLGALQRMLDKNGIKNQPELIQHNIR